jgi:hypothetical protein
MFRKPLVRAAALLQRSAALHYTSPLRAMIRMVSSLIVFMKNK